MQEPPFPKSRAFTRRAQLTRAYRGQARLIDGFVNTL